MFPLLITIIIIVVVVVVVVLLARPVLANQLAARVRPDDVPHLQAADQISPPRRISMQQNLVSEVGNAREACYKAHLLDAGSGRAQVRAALQTSEQDARCVCETTT